MLCIGATQLREVARHRRAANIDRSRRRGDRVGALRCPLIGTQISWLFDDGRLKVQPLCYDIVSGEMVNTANFLRIGA
jgi:hypothetical protein